MFSPPPPPTQERFHGIIFFISSGFGPAPFFSPKKKKKEKQSPQTESTPVYLLFDFYNHADSTHRHSQHGSSYRCRRLCCRRRHLRDNIRRIEASFAVVRFAFLRVRVVPARNGFIEGVSNRVFLGGGFSF